jgi:hypothetical protein
VGPPLTTNHFHFPQGLGTLSGESQNDNAISKLKLGLDELLKTIGIKSGLDELLKINARHKKMLEMKVAPNG